MANYTSAATVGALTGITFSDDPITRPTLTAFTIMLGLADDMINGPMKQTTNITDSYGLLEPIAAQLCVKMINNLLALAEPEDYALVDVRLSDEDKVDIRQAHSIWASLHWEIGH